MLLMMMMMMLLLLLLLLLFLVMLMMLLLLLLMRSNHLGETMELVILDGLDATCNMIMRVQRQLLLDVIGSLKVDHWGQVQGRCSWC
jgi:hypothetical protein